MLSEKRMIREKVLSLRAALTEEERALKSLKIRDVVLNLEEFRQAHTVMLFLNFRDEVETTSLAEKVLESGKTLVLPRCAPKGVLIPAEVKDLKTDLEAGTWGIREPKKENLREVNPLDIDLLFMPGAAFDLNGNRLGYGGGYYDRFLERLRENIPKIALAFSCQIVDQVPVEPFDKTVDMLITENGRIRFSKEKA